MSAEQKHYKSPLMLIIVLGLGASINPLNGSILATSYVDLAREFNISFADVSYLTTFYMAFTAALYPIFGSLGDLLGRRRLFFWGVVASTLTSVAATFSTDFTFLLVCRCLQSVSSAAIMPNAFGLLQSLVDPKKQARVRGSLGSVITIMAAIGFPLGAVLSELYGWKSLFWINVPIGITSLILTIIYLDESEYGSIKLSPVAWLGFPLLPLAIAANLNRTPGNDSTVWLALMVAVALIGLIVYFFNRSQNFRNELRYYANQQFMVSILVIVLVNAIMYAVFFVLPTWYMEALDITRKVSGLFIGVIIASMAIGGPLSGVMVDRRGSRLPALIGASLLLIALAILSSATKSFPSIIFPVAGMVLGFSFSFIGTATTHIAATVVPEKVMSLTMGLNSSARYAGGIFGTTSAAYILGDSGSVPFELGSQMLSYMMLFLAVPLLAMCLLIKRDD